MTVAHRATADDWGALVPAVAGCIGLAALGPRVDPHLVLVLLVAAWVVLAARWPAVGIAAPAGSTLHPAPGATRWWDLPLVGLVFLAAYFPPVLARYGPFGEDKYVLSAALRMLDGQQPYADFEFLYGPLILVPLTGWLRTFGYSLQSYYWLLALVEALTFAVLLALLARIIPTRRQLLAAFGLSVLFLVNDNLGLSWIALRRLLPVATLVVLACQGWSWRTMALVAGMIAVQVMISIEFAAAAVAGVSVAGLGLALYARRLQPLVQSAAAAAAGIGLGLLGGGALLGSDDAVAWIGATLTVIRERGGGEAGFPFQWSVNAIAVFLIIFLAAGRFGRGLRSRSAVAFAPGDTLLVAGLGYALVAMKSGFGRSDMYHLVPPILGLLASGLLPLEARAFPFGLRARRAMTFATVLLVLTWTPGLAGAGRLWAEGLVRGGRDILAGSAPDASLPARTRAPHAMGGRSRIPPEIVALAEHLADPRRILRPVVFYGSTWGLDRMIGVPKPRGVYATDDYLVNEAHGASIHAYLEEHPTAVVLINRDTWQFLAHQAELPRTRSMFWIGGSYTWPVRFLERWSSSHYGTAVVAEEARKRERWARTVGQHLPGHFGVSAEFGEWLVLERQP